MTTGKSLFTSPTCCHPVTATGWNRSGFCILIVTFYLIDLKTSKPQHPLERSFFMRHSLFMNLHQLAPCVDVFGISTGEEESPFSLFPGGDLHSQEIQGLAELSEHVCNAAGENGKCCMASVESCYVHGTDNCRKEERDQESSIVAHCGWWTSPLWLKKAVHLLSILSKDTSIAPAAPQFCMLTMKKAILKDTFNNT